MPYSMGCATPLSNFEANLNYKDVQDPAVVVKFPMVDDPKTSFVAWTTTPWTLPSNLALCVNPTHTYLKVQGNPKSPCINLTRQGFQRNLHYPRKQNFSNIQNC
jgi:isoleucyl-tRNA synthetase